MQDLFPPSGAAPSTSTSLLVQAPGASTIGSGTFCLVGEWLDRSHCSIAASGINNAAKLYEYTRFLDLLVVPKDQLWRHSLDSELVAKILDSHHAVRTLEKTLEQMIGPELQNEPGVSDDMRNILAQLSAELNPQKRQASETVEAELDDMKKKYYQSEDEAV